jgi:hypothetical protein
MEAIAAGDEIAGQFLAWPSWRKRTTGLLPSKPCRLTLSPTS